MGPGKFEVKKGEGRGFGGMSGVVTIANKSA